MPATSTAERVFARLRDDIERDAHRRLAFEDLERRSGCANRLELAEVLGVASRQLYRLIESGLDFHQADYYAVRLGLHPSEVWGDEWEVRDDE